MSAVESNPLKRSRDISSNDGNDPLEDQGPAKVARIDVDLPSPTEARAIVPLVCLHYFDYHLLICLLILSDDRCGARNLEGLPTA